MTSTQTEVTPVRTEGRKKFLHYVFTTALEGGINYWATVETYHWSEGIGADDLDGFNATITSSEEDWGVSHLSTGYGLGENEPIRIDLEVVERGVNLMVDKIIAAAKSENPKAPFSDPYLRQFVEQWLTDLELGDSDADGCDLALQLGLFGEVVYG